MSTNGGAIISLAQYALEKAQVDPRDDPRIMARRLGFSLDPVTSHEAPAYELVGVRRCRYRWAPDRRRWGHHVRLGLGALLLQINGLPLFDDLIVRIAGRLMLPEAAGIVDPDDHPYAPVDVLEAELRRRLSTMSGIYRVPRTA